MGWTAFTPSGDSRLIYVSSSLGSDSNDGLSEASPKATIAAGYALLRAGFPDWLQLKCGDVFDESAGDIEAPVIDFKLWGRSKAEPMRICSYGTGARPKVLLGGRTFLRKQGGGGATADSGNYLAITGLDLSTDGHDGTSAKAAIFWLGNGQDLLIEGNFIHDHGYGLHISSDSDEDSARWPRDVVLRRNIFYNLWSTSLSQGFSCSGTDGLLLEENVFDHCGHSVDGDAIPEGNEVRNHNVYIGTTQHGSVVFRGNVSARACLHGVMIRSSGDILNNLFIRNPIAVLLGGGDPDPFSHTHGVTGSIKGNVVTESSDIVPNGPIMRRLGITMANIGLLGAEVEDNLVAHCYSTGGGACFGLFADVYGSGVGVNNVQFRRNIAYNWRGPVQVSAIPASPPSPSTFCSISGNQFHDLHVQDTIPDSTNQLMIVLDPTAGISLNGSAYYSPRTPNTWFQLGQSWVGYSTWQETISDEGADLTPQEYPDPTRSVGGYMVTRGEAGTIEAYLAALRAMDLDTWNESLMAPAVNDWMRAGFGMSYDGEEAGSAAGRPRRPGLGLGIGLGL